MKKWIWLIPLSIALMLVGCREKKPAEPSQEMRVLSTTAMIGDLVQEIGGERICSFVLIKGALDPHSYELVKGDAEKIDEAKIVFLNGLNLEHGASLNYKIRSHPHAVAVGDYLLANHQEYMIQEGAQVDPHVWMDLFLWSKVIDPIVNALAAEDPEGAGYYRQRGAFLQEKMHKLHHVFKSRLQAVPESKRYLVTSHDAFGYFTRGYLATEQEVLAEQWKSRCMAPEGLAPEGQIGALSLQKVIDYLEQNQVHVVFPESNVHPESLRKIVLARQEKNKPIRLSSARLYGDAMGENSTYFAMMEHNVTVLIEEWENNERS